MNTPIENHPMVGVGYIYKPSEPPVEIVKPDASLVLAAGMEVRVVSVFANWNDVPGLDMLYVFVPATGKYTHVAPSDLNVDPNAHITVKPQVETYKAGSTVHVVQELGGTFAFPKKEAADAFYAGETGAVDLCRGTYVLRADHASLDAVADEAATYFKAEPDTTPVTHRLVGWGDFDTIGADYVLPRLFGHLVQLATPVLVEFHSDLYRDAQWLPKNVMGPCELDFVVRRSGTFLGLADDGAAWNMARTYMESPVNWFEGDRFYRLALTVDDRGEWSLTVTERDLRAEA